MVLRSRLARVLTASVLLLALAGCSALLPIEATPVATPHNVEDDDDFGSVEVYQVSADGSLSPTPGHEARRVWQMFEQVVTPIFAGATMLSYRAGDSAESDTLAYVYRDEKHPDLWNLAANLAYADDRQLLLSTLVHEYGHILSLDETDVPPRSDGECTTLQLYEGCATETSAIVAFQREFWDRYGSEAPDPSASDIDHDFYTAHEEDFVSDYASTSVTEDFAETFMTFVLEDEPSGSSPLADKFAFFYARPEFVTIRDRIRTDFGL